MKRSGQIVLFRFPQADLQEGKLRPAFLLGKLPGEHGDWLICMISSQVRHYVPEFDEIVREEDSDFATSGLKVASVIRSFVLDALQSLMLVFSRAPLARSRPIASSESKNVYLNGLKRRRMKRPPTSAANKGILRNSPRSRRNRLKSKP